MSSKQPFVGEGFDVFYLALSFLDGEGFDVFYSTLSFIDGEGFDVFSLVLSLLYGEVSYEFSSSLSFLKWYVKIASIRRLFTYHIIYLDDQTFLAWNRKIIGYDWLYPPCQYQLHLCPA